MKRIIYILLVTLIVNITSSPSDDFASFVEGFEKEFGPSHNAEIPMALAHVYTSVKAIGKYENNKQEVYDTGFVGDTATLLSCAKDKETGAITCEQLVPRISRYERIASLPSCYFDVLAYTYEKLYCQG